jgi:hypothetical protein
MVRHNSAVAELAALLEWAGDRLLSERELLACERAEGKRLFSAQLTPDRFHRPDLIWLSAGVELPKAIEVELTPKAASRLDGYLFAWAQAVAEGRFSSVVYFCPSQTRSLLERAIERTGTQDAIAVRGL